MPVAQIKTEPRCKICSSPYRSRIEEMLFKRSRAESDEQGRWNLSRVLAAMEKLGVHNPTKENVIGHWKKHCEVVETLDTVHTIQDDQRHKEAVAAISLEMAERALGADFRERVLTPDEYLVLVRIAAQHDLILKMTAGERTGATIDHGLKSVGEVTKRKSSEALDDVRKGIGASIAAYYEDEEVPSELG